MRAKSETIQPQERGDGVSRVGIHKSSSATEHNALKNVKRMFLLLAAGIGWAGLLLPSLL